MFADNKWVLHDLDSSNGTKVNGKKIKEPTTLNSGDMIYIASEAAKIEFDEKKADVLFKYNHSAISWLRKKGYLKTESEEF